MLFSDAKARSPHMPSIFRATIPVAIPNVRDRDRRGRDFRAWICGGLFWSGSPSACFRP
jgi:hypothetical protein